jgi:hypothetical protein
LAEVDGLSVHGMYGHRRRSASDLDAQILSGGGTRNKKSGSDHSREIKPSSQRADWKVHSRLSQQSEAAPR